MGTLSEQQAKQNIKYLLDYASERLFLQECDRILAENTLLDILGLDAPFDGETEKDKSVYDALSELSAYAASKKLCAEDARLRFETKLMGVLTPSPSRIIEMFDNTARYESTEAACSMLYGISENSTYIRRPDIDKNIVWEHDPERGKIIVTINLAKPEKTPEEVNRAKEAKTGYPKCLLCAQNCGFAGNAAMPARQTLRIIPFELDGEDWFMQYSPYHYFDKHMIAVSCEHRPMKVDEAAFRRMLDFIELFPHFFIGSNAALPIVGGSILAHDHYQGGSKVLPVFERPARRYIPVPDFPDVNLSVVDWYNSIIRIESKNRAQLLKLSEKFRSAWASYSDNSVNIVAQTSENGQNAPHNAVTPIAAFNSDGEYQLNLILRNNRTDKNHPFGIFHPAQELHNIKQESIGLIEAMGLFILPGRLQKETAGIRDILTGAVKLDFKSIAEEAHPLHKHLGMIAQLVSDNGTSMRGDKADEVITDYINTACEKILDTTAVFKNTADGQDAFDRFISSVIA
jgi:UDPglucose--hexose-1-phosphate uridylyltransferase